MTTLQGPSYHKLYDILSSEWAADLGITSHGSGYFYNQAEYEEMQTLLSSTSEEFLFHQLDEARSQAENLQSEVTKLRTQVDKLRKQNNRLKKRTKSLASENQDLRAKNAAIKQSTIWKIGRIVTWPFRKLKKLLKRK